MNEGSSQEAGSTTGKRLLVVDDDDVLLRLVADTFSRMGCQVDTASDGEEGLRKFLDGWHDLVLLDVLMPRMNGWQVCARIRELSDVPVIFLTALGQQEDAVRGLDCGAVDYIRKPFGIAELGARVRAALRQASLAAAPRGRPTYAHGHLRIDLDRRRALVQGEPVELTATEYRLLACLLRHAGRVLTFAEILEEVWGPQYQGNANYVHVYVWRRRKKLEKDPRQPEFLLSERGVGYRLARPDAASARAGSGPPRRRATPESEYPTPDGAR